MIDALVQNDRLLVIGYGGRDDHTNAWLEQFVNIHVDMRRVAWVGMLSGRASMERTPEKTMLGLISGGCFQALKHYFGPDSPEQLFDCGPLQLVASGFPIKPETQALIVEFLAGSNAGHS